MQLSISENAHRNEIDHKTNTENILLIARTPAAKCECSSVGNCLLLRIKTQPAPAPSAPCSFPVLQPCQARRRQEPQIWEKVQT